MKKNTKMRVASVLLVAVLLTTCAISGTFAKYKTIGKSEDTARVAKWGVRVTGSATTFAKSYNETGSITVSSNTDEKVVAPGTSGSLADFTIAGTPEVAVEVVYTADLELTGWTLSNGTTIYCPIVFTVAGTEYKIKADESLDDFEERVEAAIEHVSTSYAVGATIGSTLSVSWSWTFTGNDNTNDTDLGDRAATDNASKITLNVTCTVNQSD